MALTVNFRIFVRKSRKASKDVFATLKYVTETLVCYISKRQSDIAISHGFYFFKILTMHTHKFSENKTLAKISAFTVL